MKVKIFSKTKDGKFSSIFQKLSEMSSLLEQDVNAWLESHPNIKIIEIKQSSCGGSLENSKHIISIWYETDF